MVVVEAFTGKVPFPESANVHVVLMVSKGGRPPKPPGCERLGLVPAIWKLTVECWNQNPDRRPDIASVLSRFQATVGTGLYQSTSFPGTDAHCQDQLGEEKPPSPVIGKIKNIGLLPDSVQQRINKLDQVSFLAARLRSKFNAVIQELDKDTVPEGERPAKLNQLSKLCGNHKLIPDSMKLQGLRENSSEVKEYKGPYSVYQSEFKGRKVAVKVLRLYVPQRIDDPLKVSVVSCPPPL